MAHEFSEFIAVGNLGPLLEAENDHSYLCELGVWYWQLGHRELALACYRRSLQIHAEAPTYFNLAVCLDDIASDLKGNSSKIRQRRREYIAESVDALKSCFELVATSEELSSLQAMLKQNGKEHLVKAASSKRPLRTKRKQNKAIDSKD